MTIQDYINKLDSKIAELKNGKWLELASMDAHDEMAQRIFVSNENTKGETFQYSPNTKSIKQQKGQQTSRVSFKDTNDLQLDFLNNGRVNKEGQFAYKVNLKRSRNVIVKEKLNEKYDLVFGINKREIKLFKESAEFNFNKIMKK